MIVGSIPCPELISWPRETIRPPKEWSGCRGGNHGTGMRERFARNSEQRRTTSDRCSSAVIGRRKLISRVIGWKSLWGCGLPSGEKKIWNASRICVSSLRRGHANLLCIVPILVYVPPKRVQMCRQIMAAWCSTGTTYEETCQSPRGKVF